MGDHHEDGDEVKATVIVVNSEASLSPPTTSSQHLDDSGVEISENGSCSSAEVEVECQNWNISNSSNPSLDDGFSSISHR